MSQRCSAAGCTRWAFDHGLCRQCGGSAPPAVAQADAGRSVVAAQARAAQQQPEARAQSRQAQPEADVQTVVDFHRDLPSCSDVILSCASSTGDLCVTLQATDQPARNPLHCILVLDVSGSMDSSATENVAGGSQESAVNFTRLDLAKHSSKVIVEVMGDNDSVTILTFSTDAKVQLKQTNMTASGKIQAQSVIDNLSTDGSTNLIEASRLALASALADRDSSNIHIMILTDGEPDNAPGVLPDFRRALSSLEAERAAGRHHGVCISTFGFGYAMNSELLLQMSSLGHGMFSYIPDSSMIGTVFCNFVANAMCVAHSVIDVQIELENATFQTSGNPTTLAFAASGLQFGQLRHFAFKISQTDSRPSSFSVRVLAIVGGSRAVALSCVDPEPKFPLLTEQAALVSYLTAIGSLSETAVRQMLSDLPPASTSEFIRGLHRDLISDNPQEGQVLLGLSNSDYRKKWGLHYTRSLWCAHKLQQCHNFKDPSVQLYGGSMFRSIADAADAAFCTMPAPRPSGHSTSSAPSAPVDMSMFMDRYGGCFAPQSLVKLFDGSSCEIQSLRRGMHVWGGARVNYVLRMNYNAVVPMVSLETSAGSPAALVTPWHPVLFGGEWSFPCRISSPAPRYMECVYNVVLSDDHVITVNGLQFITLGHCNDSHPVLVHSFFGTQAVVRSLQQRDVGQDVITVSGVFRDRNGLVCGFLDDEEPPRASSIHNFSRALQVSCQ